MFRGDMKSVVSSAVVVAALGASAMLAMPGLAAEGGPYAKAAPAIRVILSEKHFWRKHYTFFPPSLSVQSAEAAGLPADADSRAKLFAKTHDMGLRTPPPPPEWRSPDFPDGDWLLYRGRDFSTGDGRLIRISQDATNVCLRGGDPFNENIGLVSYRGKFVVKDRGKAGKLWLTLTYRGGFVAYLNGKEVARAHLPDGAIQPTTPAEDYPLSAWFYTEDKSEKEKTKGHYLNAFDANAPWGLRERTFGPKEVPAHALRDGLNVLAIEIHRSEYPAEVARKKYEAGWQRGWSTLGLSLLSFQCDGPEDAVLDPGPKAPAGLRAWAVDITRQVSSKAAPCLDEGQTPVRIVAARNGAFSGQVVAAADKPLENLTAKVSALRHAEGKGSIPASAVQVRYAVSNPFWQSRKAYYGPVGLDYFSGVVPTDLTISTQGDIGHRLDMLLDAPPQPALPCVGLWLTVRVPKDAPAGLYRGELAVGTQGAQPVAVPVEVSVADWTLPDLKDYATLLMIYQSPETLAAYYKVKPWSEEHWKLIERSLKLMGEGGNVGLQLNLLAKGCMGNEDSWVIWDKKPDGAYDYDFAIFDHYVKTAMKYHDPARIKAVVLNIWGLEAGKVYADNVEKYGGSLKSGSVRVTARDPATGNKEDLSLPPYGSPDCEKLLKPLLLIARKHLADAGLADKIMWGKGSDDYPLPEHVAMLERIIPGTPWYRESHWDSQTFRYGPKSDKSKVVRVGASSIVWGGRIPPPFEKRFYGWQYDPKHIVFNFNRPGVDCLCLLGYPPPWSFHMWGESTIACGRNGNGNVGGDFWPIVGSLGKLLPAGGSAEMFNGGGTFCGLYPSSNMGRNGVGNNTVDLFGPGPEGPVSTVRFENALENNQESEARIFIEKAPLAKEKPLPADLARKCQDMLDERTNVLRYQALGAGRMAPYLWQERNLRLFDAAAQVQKLAGE